MHGGAETAAGFHCLLLLACRCSASLVFYGYYVIALSCVAVSPGYTKLLTYAQIGYQPYSLAMAHSGQTPQYSSDGTPLTLSSGFISSSPPQDSGQHVAMPAALREEWSNAPEGPRGDAARMSALIQYSDYAESHRQADRQRTGAQVESSSGSDRTRSTHSGRVPLERVST